MRSTGIVRKLDELGRIVLPIEMRRSFGLEEKDPVEILVDGDTIVLRKFQQNCTFCGSSVGLMEFKGKNVCRKCVSAMSDL